MNYYITCNTDDKFAQHCCVMLCSLFENNKDITFEVHLLTKSLSNINLNAITKIVDRYGNFMIVHFVDESRLDGVQFRKKRPLSKAAYYRILLPEILSDNISKILYLDCDIVVLGSVKELYEMDITNYALAACQDACPYTELHREQLGFDLKDRTFCSGVMMINLDFWRKSDAQNKLLAYSKQKRKIVYLHDQDALNYVFKDKWFMLPYKWNKATRSYAVVDFLQKSFDIQEYVFHPRILHYASPLKPWFDVWYPEKKYYVKYLNLSEYPSPVFVHVNRVTRIKEWCNTFRYLLNRYLRPLLPNFLEMILLDIFCWLKIIYIFLFDRNKFKVFMLSLWLRKYKRY